MPLEWSEVQNPSQDVPYTHVIAQTPLGRIVLDWKGWKENSSPCGTMPWGEFVIGADLDHAKQLVQLAFNRVVIGCLPLCDFPTTTTHVEETKPD